MKTALVLGAGGFIGNHMVKRLKEEGYWVRGVDLKYPEYGKTEADHFVLRDLRHADDVFDLVGWAGVKRDPHQIFALQFDKPFDEIYQFAADMGGAGYIFTGDHDADVMHNSATINLNVLDAVREKNRRFKQNTTKIFYSSSACMYPEHNQLDPNNPNCAEDSAYPANPDSEYGWEKLFSERLYLAYHRNYNIPVRIARFHNIFGPLGTWDGGKEKAPAAVCRKVITGKNTIEIWGDGQQTRSFLYIDDCIDAVRLQMESDFMGPVNIGSEEMVTINDLVDIACEIGRKDLTKIYVGGPTGVRGRNSDNRLIEEKLGWKPKHNLRAGLEYTYDWIESQVQKKVSKQMKDAITL
jgi:nucleoside-diphosphate-sugar epimerase